MVSATQRGWESECKRPPLTIACEAFHANSCVRKPVPPVPESNDHQQTSSSYKANIFANRTRLYPYFDFAKTALATVAT